MTRLASAADLGALGGCSEPRLKLIAFILRNPLLDDPEFTGKLEFDLGNHRKQVQGRIIPAARFINIAEES